MRVSRCIPGVLPWGFFLAVSNRARSGWSLNRFRWVKMSLYNAWSGVSERQGIHLALILSLGCIFFASLKLIMFGIYLPFPNYSSLLKLE